MSDFYPILELDVSVEELNARGFHPKIEDDDFGERLFLATEKHSVKFLFVGHPQITKETGFVIWVDSESCSKQHLTGAEFLFYIFMELDLSENHISWRNQKIPAERWYPYRS